jgi:NAD(P)-dependent dehydrogenase (short-subunit alcohol dehydrogenase family)
MNQFDGKVAVITGGNSGIGLATARLLRQQGAQVAIAGRNKSTLDQAASELGVMAIQTDVSQPQELKAFFDTVAERLGKFDLLFANAGVFQSKPLPEVDEDLFDWHFNINVKGAYFSVQHCLPHLREGASVVLTSSMMHEAGWPGCSVYSATKAAVRSLARSFAAELAPRNIRVNTISPGVTHTPILDWPGMSEQERTAVQDGIRTQIPMGRFAAPEEIAQAVLYLAGSATYMTGGDLLLDGGMTTL